MQEFSSHSRKVLELINEVAKDLNINVPGTECLLIALAKVENSVCKFLLNEYSISAKDIMYEVKHIYILRTNKEQSYTTKLLEVLDNAREFSNNEQSKLVYDEHLFYSLLTTKSTLALEILRRLNLPIDSAIDDISNMFDFSTNEDNTFLVNLTKEAKLNKLKPFIGRTSYIDRVIRILSKKQKNNPMLIGSAGVGKSALVEGVAQKLLKIKPHINIYRLDIGTVIAGTKYRGDLEERLLDIIERVKNPNSILFIDEIHNIVGSGSSEGTLDIANILKPILSRGEIKVIGATTLDEYYRHLEKDKALVRRFQNIFIDEASNQETYQILKGISFTFENFYKIKYSNQILHYIIEMSALIPNRKLPDKAIDIIDEVGLIASNEKKNNVQLKHVDQIVYEYLGIKYDNLYKNINKIKYFPHLKKYYLIYLMNLELRNNILNVVVDSDEAKSQLLEDLKFVFNIKDEMILNLDLNDYQDGFYSSSLIGSPKGYVGYEEGGILSEHVLKFPMSVIAVKNYQNSNKSIQKIINNAILGGKITDSKGRIISFKNTFFIFDEYIFMKPIGFLKNETNQKIDFIDEFLTKKIQSNIFKDKLVKILDKLKRNNYLIKSNINNIDYNIYNKIIGLISDLDKFDPNKTYLLSLEDEKVKISIK